MPAIILEPVNLHVFVLLLVCRVGYYGPNCDKFCQYRRHLPCNRETGIPPDGCEEERAGANSNTSRKSILYFGFQYILKAKP